MSQIQRLVGHKRPASRIDPPKTKMRIVGQAPTPVRVRKQPKLAVDRFASSGPAKRAHAAVGAAQITQDDLLDNHHTSKRSKPSTETETFVAAPASHASRDPRFTFAGAEKDFGVPATRNTFDTPDQHDDNGLAGPEDPVSQPAAVPAPPASAPQAAAEEVAAAAPEEPTTAVAPQEYDQCDNGDASNEALETIAAPQAGCDAPSPDAAAGTTAACKDGNLAGPDGAPVGQPSSEQMEPLEHTPSCNGGRVALSKQMYDLLLQSMNDLESQRDKAVANLSGDNDTRRCYNEYMEYKNEIEEETEEMKQKIAALRSLIAEKGYELPELLRRPFVEAPATPGDHPSFLVTFCVVTDAESSPPEFVHYREGPRAKRLVMDGECSPPTQSCHF